MKGLSEEKLTYPAFKSPATHIKLALEMRQL